MSLLVLMFNVQSIDQINYVLSQTSQRRMFLEGSGSYFKPRNEANGRPRIVYSDGVSVSRWNGSFPINSWRLMPTLHAYWQRRPSVERCPAILTLTAPLCKSFICKPQVTKPIGTTADEVTRLGSLVFDNAPCFYRNRTEICCGTPNDAIR